MATVHIYSQGRAPGGPWVITGAVDGRVVTATADLGDAPTMRQMERVLLMEPDRPEVARERR